MNYENDYLLKYLKYKKKYTNRWHADTYYIWLGKNRT